MSALLSLLSSKLKKISGNGILLYLIDSYCAAEEAKLDKERRVMKDIPGWEVGKSVYHTRKWMPRPEY